MSFSLYHQSYANKSDEDIQKRTNEKEQELNKIFENISLQTDSNSLRLVVLGCPDKRMVKQYEIIFEKVLKRKVEVITFDITIDHLIGESNIIQHDCTLPFPKPTYDITYGHVLLKFIETEKQFAVLINSFESLKLGGIAIHVFDREEIEAKEINLPDGLWSVPLAKWKQKLSEHNIEYKEVQLKHGPALILKR
jgi:hypothetical protein